MKELIRKIIILFIIFLFFLFSGILFYYSRPEVKVKKSEKILKPDKKIEEIKKNLTSPREEITPVSKELKENLTAPK